MRVLICGGRDYNDEAVVFKALDKHCDPEDDLTIIHGGARGADTLAGKWALLMGGCPVEVYKPDWSVGKVAGILRNIQMLKTGIDLVIAFPGGRGTAHMMKIAREAGVEVREIQ